MKQPAPRHMKIKTLLTLATISTSLGTSLVHAELSLHINPVDKTFALTGSASGIPFDNGLGGVTRWVAPDLGFERPATDSIILNDDLTFTTSQGTSGNGVYDTILNTDELNGGSISFILATSTAAFQTLTGLGNFTSYSSLTPVNQAKFESLSGRSFNLTGGSGFGPLAVVSVPEPSSMCLAFAAGSVLIWRRKRA